MNPRAKASILALLALTPAVLSSCTETDLAGRILSVDAQGSIVGVAYFDSNGNGEQDIFDALVEDLDVRLYTAGTRSLAASATSDSKGVFRFDDVPVGRLSLEPDSDFFGDSLTAFDFETREITLRAGVTEEVTLGVTFPSFTLAELRALPVGKKGFTQGIVLNPRDPFGDGSVHLQDGDSYLRVIGTPRTALFPGDSVRMLGRVAQEAGQPILEEGEPFLLAQQVLIPQALEFTTGSAAGADGGSKDAALVRIRDADVLDTISVTSEIGRDLHMTVDDGSGPLELILLELGAFNLAQVHPDSFSVQEAAGLLVPQRTGDGSVRWRMVARSAADLIMERVGFPEQVTNLTVVDGTTTTLTLNWTEVDDGFGGASSYEARFRPITTLAWTDVTVGSCASPIAGTAIDEVASCVIEGLTPETTYFFQVRGFRGTLGVDAKFGPWSNTTGATTLPLPPPE